VLKKVEQINDHLFIETYNSNNIKIGVNDMTVNDIFGESDRWPCVKAAASGLQTLSSLIFIKVNGPKPAEYKPDYYVQQWMCK